MPPAKKKTTDLSNLSLSELAAQLEKRLTETVQRVEDDPTVKDLLQQLDKAKAEAQKRIDAHSGELDQLREALAKAGGMVLANARAARSGSTGTRRRASASELSAAEQEIRRLLTDAKGQPLKLAQLFDEGWGITKNTAGAVIKRLAEAGEITKHGSGNATTYSAK